MENKIWNGYRTEDQDSSSSSDDEIQKKQVDCLEIVLSGGEEKNDYKEPIKSPMTVEYIARRIQKVKLLGNSRRKTRTILKLHKRMQDCLDHRKFLQEKIAKLQAENRKLLQDLNYLQIQAA